MLKEPPRERTKETRAGVTRTIHDACGFKLYMNINFYATEDGGGPSEIFLTVAKKGSMIGGFARTLAVLLSLMFQYGIPWEVIYSKLDKMKFDPMTSEYTSLVDAIAQNMNEIITVVKEKT